MGTERRTQRGTERGTEGEGGGGTLSFFIAHYDPHPIYFHLSLHKYPRLIISRQNLFLYKLLILSS